jgi:hypothetical protein
MELLMKKQNYPLKQALQRFALIMLIVVTLVSCEILPVVGAPKAGEMALGGTTNAVLSEPSATVPPPVLPSAFQTSLLDPLDIPHTYIQDTCRYLRNKWNPLNAEPGTVVMVVMIDEIHKGTVEGAEGISVVEFVKVMEHLKAQGFEAINMKQFQVFVERNVMIPPRSVLLIQDGNRDTEYLERNFNEYRQNWGWTIINGWVSDPQTPEALLEENAALEREGWVDHQAQGVTPDARLTDETAKTVIGRELQGPLEVFANSYGKRPIALIWPNGGFGYRPVEAARQLGYRLGFTSNPRGPVMYNWVPLADESDPQRPSYPPEGRINDPLMTLPRFPIRDVINAIDLVRAIGKEAADYHLANKELEHEYYEVVCEPDYGRMPTP